MLGWKNQALGINCPQQGALKNQKHFFVMKGVLQD